LQSGDMTEVEIIKEIADVESVGRSKPGVEVPA
jgi:hypothetical protein